MMMLPFALFRKFVFVVAVSALSVAVAQQPSVVNLSIATSRDSATVRSISISGQEFVALSDLSNALSLRYFENQVLRKVEVRLTNAVLKFTADNPFIVQTDLRTKRSAVHQFPQSVTVVNGLYFVPKTEIGILISQQHDSSFTIGTDTTAIPVAPPLPPVISGLTVETKMNGTLLRIRLTAPIKEFSRTSQVGEWIYVTLPGALGDTVSLDTTFPSGMIRRIKPVQTVSALQLSVQIRGKIETSEIVQDQTSNDVLVTLIPPQKAVNTDSIRRHQEAMKRREAAANQVKQQKEKWKLDVIVLDPGHGGHDPGTIGVIGTREKDITLGISLKLGALIERYMPDVRVVHTRKTDRFVELFRRGQIANEAGGKLFISIHCNSTEKKPSNANGFEIYLLRPGRTEDAIRIAEKENEVVKLEKNYEARYQELNQENFIILTMAQSAYVKQSERFAELLEETMSAEMEAQRQPVRQAGFYVLVGASMPNVLIEAGYLSNPKEEKFLRSPDGQQKIAEAILKALQRYTVEYEQNIDG
jgi:N-acetylmuramoyl-L-alanine amidase